MRFRLSGAAIALLVLLHMLGDMSQAQASWPPADDAGRTAAFATVGPGTGQKLWKFKTEKLNIFATPAAAGDFVFVGAQDRSLYSLQAATGTLVWRFETNGPISASPIVANETIFVASEDGYLYAVNATTGHEVWRTFLEPKLAATPAFAGGILYLGPLHGIFYAVDATTGHIAWSQPVRVPDAEPPTAQSPPLVLGDSVFFAPYEGDVFALSRADGTLVWQAPLWAGTNAPLAAAGSLLIGSGNGYLYAVDIHHGSMAWTVETRLRPDGPALRDGIAYYGDLDGIHALRVIDRETLWSQPGFMIAHGTGFAVSERTLYFVNGKDSVLVALDRESGRLEWQTAVAMFVQCSPILSDGRLFVGSSQYHLFALDAGANAPPASSAQPATPAPKPIDGLEAEGASFALFSAAALWRRRVHRRAFRDATWG